MSPYLQTMTESKVKQVIPTKLIDLSYNRTRLFNTDSNKSVVFLIPVTQKQLQNNHLSYGSYPNLSIEQIFKSAFPSVDTKEISFWLVKNCDYAEHVGIVIKFKTLVINEDDSDSVIRGNLEIIHNTNTCIEIWSFKIKYAKSLLKSTNIGMNRVFLYEAEEKNSHIPKEIKSKLIMIDYFILRDFSEHSGFSRIIRRLLNRIALLESDIKNTWVIEDVEKIRGFQIIKLCHWSNGSIYENSYIFEFNEDIKKHLSSKDDFSPLFESGCVYNIEVTELNRGSIHFQSGNYQQIYTLTDQHFRLFKRDSYLEDSLKSEYLSFTSNLPKPALYNGTDSSFDEDPDIKCKLHILNVGQGDTIVIEFPGSKIWIIDAFFEDPLKHDDIKAWFKSKFSVHTLEKLFISHLHQDHIESIPWIIKELHPQEIIIGDSPPKPSQLANDILDYIDRYSSILEINILKKIKDIVLYNFNEISIRIIPTQRIKNYKSTKNDTNAHGLIVTITTAKSFVLLTGDLPGKLLFNMLDDLPPGVYI